MRRDFLKLCGLAGLGLAVPFRSRESRAAGKPTDEPYPGPFYVVFNASGGWDTTYLMDPKGVNGINRLYKDGDILTKGAHKYAPNKAHAKGGLCNEDFYSEFGAELLTFNGLDYSTNNHSPGARYMATGKLDSTEYPTFAALVAACRGPNCPLAFLTFGNYSATGNLVAMSRVPYLPSLKKIALADAMDGNERSPYHDKFALDRIEEALRETNEAAGAAPRLPRAERAENMLYAAQVNSKALQRVAQYIPATSPKERMAQQVEIALASFKAGVCVSANLTIGQFDSHANNDADQMKLIPEFLAGVAYLMRRAGELKIREQIVVVVQSEMGRTPDYNAGNGKDHWSIGSALFLGRGIKGNRVVGATDAKQFAMPLAPATLALDKDKGIKVRPEHVHLALRELAGITDHPLSKKFPLGVPEREKLRGLWTGA
ncbi:hypothetical protein GobsT_19330 [Gemmata obscuriglobus]|uniref:DUF1501 domain-containing protein n=1 Tax=Gemmata obscuriglobus TaxID=114 RepID=A0A2Z3GYY8_9BACT|nr:DUF1501 domain-containing protein [Gemmata obscuriglobus]AWM39709.1 DUF1501 domain-containing protein [Gemmata obscuriglobus]QEG27179.1 hypothetical protein GobsT_19330 [Gemmata obscuriglobus]VTS03835.1 Uncharacterized protein OS=Chthoniobacter flavus Ellin428 GN=CfE428DRAFT_3811 PE=4 SV=1: DUF1501 [Gemmata obscuriglobus UQM 2246]